jgi:hypothetical protein
VEFADRIVPTPSGDRQFMIKAGRDQFLAVAPASYPIWCRCNRTRSLFIPQRPDANECRHEDCWPLDQGLLPALRSEVMRDLYQAILVFGWIWLAFAAKPSAAEKSAPLRPAQKNTVVQPADLPADLAVLDVPRNWGDTFLPKSKPPAREVLSVPLAGLKTDERIALTCLQGLLDVAACEDLIVASPQLAERLGLPVKLVINW